jgi:succinate dehydrogenase/fumarate reductase flavoprotein subunit
MNNQNEKTLHEEVANVLDYINHLFEKKNEQYRATDDDLANFTTGAMLRYGKADMPARFETLKDYVAKHIAKVYNGRLTDDGMIESIVDIAVYFIIAAVMHKRAKQRE